HPLFCRPVSSPGSIFGPRVETAGAPPTPNSAQWSDFFNSLLEDVPEGEVADLCRRYLQEILSLVGKAYRRFDIYVDPRALFTMRALEVLNWSIEDLEVALGFPKGWTYVPDWEGDLDSERLHLLSTQAGDEEMEQWLAKYNIVV
ncbi:MAG: hypothetical protein AB1941_18295, partial [Gemmatimonadota bacterium]